MRNKCEVCSMLRVVNRYGYCRECWKAQDRTMSGFDAIAVFTASHTIADILIAKATIGVINPLIRNGLRQWKYDEEES